MNKRAVISVSDKTGLGDFARGLVELGFQIISTGGTARYLTEEKVPVTKVAEITGFPEILGGRIKTLHPALLGGILARRNMASDLQQLKEQEIEFIDLVVVNLYPFAQTIARKDVTLTEAVENIDIGGPTMVRAAAKNYSSVAVVVNPARYDSVLAELKKGELDENFRFRLATEAFAHTAEYDALISRYLANICPEVPDFPPYISFPFIKVADLRYGENPQQGAAFYKEVTAISNPASITSARQLQGKELSFNNYNDLDAAWEMALQFKEPTVVAVKHTNPCGIASADSVYQAYLRAFDSDPVSIFGGIIAVNTEVDAVTAQEMSSIFLEAIIAPAFSPGALDILKKKKDLRLLQAAGIHRLPGIEWDYKKISGGLLIQEKDQELIEPSNWKVVTKRVPTREEMDDLIFGVKVVKHVKSNAIVLTRKMRTVGIGAGQMNRVGAARIAIEQAGHKVKDSVLASDAYFPFKDTVEIAAKAGIKAIIQPGGSIRDKESITEADNNGIAMVFTGRRYFKH